MAALQVQLYWPFQCVLNLNATSIENPGMIERTESDPGNGHIPVDGVQAKLQVTVDVTDWPEFGWRGCLLDCARHFMPVAYIARHIEALSLFKMNVLHWHLTDDQVWTASI